jgi:sigma-E factor negative regulatory protein RseC
MLYQAGHVTEIRRNRARVEFKPGPACHSCLSGYGCGLGPLLDLFRRRPGYSIWIELKIAGNRRIEVGDSVKIGLHAAELIKISSLAYLLPVVGMMIGAWLVAMLLPQWGDLSAVTGAGFGIGAGWGSLAAIRNRAPVMLIA